MAPSVTNSDATNTKDCLAAIHKGILYFSGPHPIPSYSRFSGENKQATHHPNL